MVPSPLVKDCHKNIEKTNLIVIIRVIMKIISIFPDNGLLQITATTIMYQLFREICTQIGVNQYFFNCSSNRAGPSNCGALCETDCAGPSLGRDKDKK